MKGGDERRREPIKAEIRRPIEAIKRRLSLRYFQLAIIFHTFSFIIPFTLTIYTDLVFFCLEILHSLLEKIGILAETRYWPVSCRGSD